MKKIVLLSLLACLMVAGCVPFWKAKARAPATTFANGMPLHKSWCYETLGRIDCYASPQDFPQDRLVSVYPAAQYPVTHEEYVKDLAESR